MTEESLKKLEVMTKVDGFSHPPSILFEVSFELQEWIYSNFILNLFWWTKILKTFKMYKVRQCLSRSLFEKLQSYKIRKWKGRNFNKNIKIMTKVLGLSYKKLTLLVHSIQKLPLFFHTAFFFAIQVMELLRNCLKIFKELP